MTQTQPNNDNKMGLSVRGCKSFLEFDVRVTSTNIFLFKLSCAMVVITEHRVGSMKRGDGDQKPNTTLKPKLKARRKNCIINVPCRRLSVLTTRGGERDWMV
jgi:predicted RNase H-like nuclease